MAGEEILLITDRSNETSPSYGINFRRDHSSNSENVYQVVEMLKNQLFCLSFDILSILNGCLFSYQILFSWICAWKNCHKVMIKLFVSKFKQSFVGFLKKIMTSEINFRKLCYYFRIHNVTCIPWSVINKFSFSHNC